MQFIQIVFLLLLLNFSSCNQLAVQSEKEPNIIQLTLCQERSGCVSVGKYLVWSPMKDPNGDQDASKENFEYKVVLVYKDYMTIYFDDQKPELPSHANPTQFARTIYYSNLKLGCGETGNRICTAKEFQEMNSEVKYTNLVVDTLQRREIELNRQCIVLPISDGAFRDSGESLVYICEDRKDKLRDFYKFRVQLGRMIDSYQLRQLQDYYNSANSVCQKEALVKTDDSSGSMSTLMMRLYPDSLKAYEDPGNFHSEVLNIPLRDIDENLLPMQVPDGIQNAHIKETWADNFEPKPIGTCCLMIPLVNKNQKFVCTHYDNPSDFDYQDCDRKVKNWVHAISVAVMRQNTIRDYRQLAKKTKIFECQGNKATDSFKNRLESSVKSIDKMCDDLSTIAQGWNKENCLLDKNDDIVGEMREISNDNQIIVQSLEKCIKQGNINLGKTNYGLSFLQNQDHIRYRPRSFLQLPSLQPPMEQEEQEQQKDEAENQLLEKIRRLKDLNGEDDVDEEDILASLKFQQNLKDKLQGNSSNNPKFQKITLPLFSVKLQKNGEGEYQYDNYLGQISKKGEELSKVEKKINAEEFERLKLNLVKDHQKHKVHRKQRRI